MIIEADAKAEQERPQFVGGEIRISADAQTGAINISAPQNLVVTLGIIEAAKAILVERQNQAMRAAERPSIVRALPSDMPAARPS